MDQPDREAEPQFSHPVRQIILMLSVLGLTGALGYLALPRVFPVFETNPYLNGFIVFVFLIGVMACFIQVLSLISSVRWIEGFASQAPGHEDAQPPKLLLPLAALLKSRSARMQISTSSTSSILDSVATRIDEGREITRYIVNLLIFLGLLGTFYGLATTVPALVDTIRNLAPRDGEGGVEVFTRLMTGLEAQLGGMGVAFASSLLGLAGSLIVGLLELFAGHGQNRFYRELEEWLSTITRVGFSADGDGGVEQGVLAAVMDQMSLQMETLQKMFTQTTLNRDNLDSRLEGLAEKMTTVTERMADTAPVSDALNRMADSQDRLIHLMETQGQHEGIDAESRMRLRSIDVQMLRILEEISAGRQESMAELRTDLAALGRVLGQGKPIAPVKPRNRTPLDDGQEG